MFKLIEASVGSGFDRSHGVFQDDLFRREIRQKIRAPQFFDARALLLELLSLPNLLFRHALPVPRFD